MAAQPDRHSSSITDSRGTYVDLITSVTDLNTLPNKWKKYSLTSNAYQPFLKGTRSLLQATIPDTPYSQLKRDIESGAAISQRAAFNINAMPTRPLDIPAPEKPLTLDKARKEMQNLYKGELKALKELLRTEEQMPHRKVKAIEAFRRKMQSPDIYKGILNNVDPAHYQTLSLDIECYKKWTEDEAAPAFYELFGGKKDSPFVKDLMEKSLRTPDTTLSDEQIMTDAEAMIRARTRLLTNIKEGQKWGNISKTDVSPEEMTLGHLQNHNPDAYGRIAAQVSRLSDDTLLQDLPYDVIKPLSNALFLQTNAARNASETYEPSGIDGMGKKMLKTFTGLPGAFVRLTLGLDSDKGKNYFQCTPTENKDGTFSVNLKYTGPLPKEPKVGEVYTVWDEMRDRKEVPSPEERMKQFMEQMQRQIEQLVAQGCTEIHITISGIKDQGDLGKAYRACQEMCMAAGASMNAPDGAPMPASRQIKTIEGDKADLVMARKRALERDRASSDELVVRSRHAP